MRKSDALEFMSQEFDVNEFFHNHGGLIEGSKYLDSRVLQKDSTIFDDYMRLVDNYKLFGESPALFGTEWIETVEACALLDEAAQDFDIVPKFGISNNQVVSYLNTSLSSPKNIFNNEIALIEATNGSLRLNNNIEFPMKDSLK